MSNTYGDHRPAAEIAKGQIASALAIIDAAITSAIDANLSTLDLLVRRAQVEGEAARRI